MDESVGISALERSQKDPAAFDAFYARHAEAMVVFFTRRTLDPQLALELTAETFSRAFANRRQFRGDGEDAAAGWLYAIAKRLLWRFHKRGKVEQRATRRLAITTPVLDEEDLARVHELAETAALRAVVAQRFEELPEDHRDAVQLRVVQELSYAEVAARLGISESNARARVSRGLRTLRATLAASYEEQIA